MIAVEVEYCALSSDIANFSKHGLEFITIARATHINKKEHKNGGCSPDSPGEDIDATDYTLTPRTEAKYNKIDEDFQMMMQRTQHMNGAQRVTF